ncbi:MAG: hypoxanthine phosphoribosyltransferase [Desulfobacteraceae bacterium]|nr:hypoxanthine phosphoribosyltransferase [Desulfobacteraceae bacterium]
MSELIPVLSKEQIRTLVEKVAKQISVDYKGKELILIGVLKGAYIFCADIAREITLDRLKVDFLRAASYGGGTTSTEEIKLTKDIDIDITGAHVLVVEDIVDTGLTLRFLIDHLKSYNPASIKICTMIDKKERRKVDLQADYACHVVQEGFLIGYGLDYDEKYRNLPGIYEMKL